MIGLVDGKRPLYGDYVKTPMYPSTEAFELGPSDHLRFLIKLDTGHQFWSPFVRYREAHNGEFWRIEADAWTAQKPLTIVSVLIVDFSNHCIGRPANFELPCAVSTGQVVKMRALTRKK